MGIVWLEVAGYFRGLQSTILPLNIQMPRCGWRFSDRFPFFRASTYCCAVSAARGDCFILRRTQGVVEVRLAERDFYCSQRRTASFLAGATWLLYWELFFFFNRFFLRRSKAPVGLMGPLFIFRSEGTSGFPVKAPLIPDGKQV